MSSPAARAIALITFAACAAIAPAARAEPPAKKDPAKHEAEFTVVPFAGGDRDVGFGGGLIASWARVAPNEDPPHVLQIQATLSAMFSGLPQHPSLSYSDDFVAVDIPHWLPGHMRLKLRASYTRETTLKYYGLGNASRIEPNHPSNYFFYKWIHPTLRAEADAPLGHGFRLLWGAALTRSIVEVRPDSRLAEDMQNGSEYVRGQLGEPGTYGVVTFQYGLAWDSRDNEVSTHRGQYHALRVELSPGGSGYFPYRFGRAGSDLRFFVPLHTPELTLAVRWATDFLFGDPPIYELPRFQDTAAVGGAKGVRGVPAQRYYGRIKTIQNVELRSELVRTRLFDKETRFGLTAFFDSGRVFSDYHSHPELDGSGLGMKYGTGLGLRVASGKSFVLRFDVAWSPEASPIGVYLSSGQIF